MSAAGVRVQGRQIRGEGGAAAQEKELGLQQELGVASSGEEKDQGCQQHKGQQQREVQDIRESPRNRKQEQLHQRRRA